MAAFTHAVVSLPALDLRRRPDHRAELGSQLLLGEVVRLLASAPRAGWWRVRGESDGYEGWVRAWGLVPAGEARVRAWQRRAGTVVDASFVTARGHAGGGIAVSPLFLGARVIAHGSSRGWRRVELPDGRRGWVEGSALRRATASPPALVDRITSLLGTPYLWGGRTPAGMDCSAFVQIVYGERGVSLPRDAREQHAACTPLDAGEAPAVGDLGFFAVRGEPVSHVGIALGAGWFAHCRGSVRMGSLDTRNALYESGLAAQFVGWSQPPGMAPA